MIKICEKKEQKLELFFVNLFFSFIVIGYSTFKEQYIILILLVLLILIINNKYKFNLKIIFLLLILVYALFVLTIKYFAIDTKFIKTLINNKYPNFWSLRYKAINHINSIYQNKSTSDFINLILFNYKDSYSNEIYKKLIQLSIVHLFIISGLHINFLFSLIKKIFFRKEKYLFLNNCINICICLIYAYFLNFSIAIIRIMINCIIKLIKKNNSWLTTNSFSGIFILLIFSKEVINYGFLMSYLCVITIGLVINNNLSKLIKAIVINFFCILITLPIIIEINGQINVFAIFLSIFYVPVTFFSYFWFLLFAWWQPFLQINILIFSIINAIMDWTIKITFHIKFEKIQSFIVVLYYYFAFLLIHLWQKLAKNIT